MAETQLVTQIEKAKAGITTPEMEAVAASERLTPDFVLSRVAQGKMVIPANINHKSLKVIGIGMDCRTKVNANIGNSSVTSGIEEELAKLDYAVKLGSHTVMDLSTGGDVDKIRRAIIAHSPIPVGTVPLYQAIRDLQDKEESLDPDYLFEIIDRQGQQGVDYITVHCGLLRDHIPLAEKRVTGIVSRGGSLLAAWMRKNGKENPLYDRYDDLLALARRYDMTLSLGDGLRPGCLADASDAAQFAELEVLGDLVHRARAAGVQTMVEGPGHIPFHQIQMNVERQIEACDGAPFYVLGPVVTDIAPGYDHITSAIGGTMAAFHGAAMLCYVTPKEHLGLPGIDDVRDGVIAAMIAAHAADVARGRPGVQEQDNDMARARFAFDWEKQFSLAMDPESARRIRTKDLPENTEDYCTMCGPEFCAMRIMQNQVCTHGKSEEKAGEA